MCKLEIYLALPNSELKSTIHLVSNLYPMHIFHITKQTTYPNVKVRKLAKKLCKLFLNSHKTKIIYRITTNIIFYIFRIRQQCSWIYPLINISYFYHFMNNMEVALQTTVTGHIHIMHARTSNIKWIY